MTSHRRLLTPAFWCGLAVALVLAVPARASSVESWLRQRFGVDPGELARLARGEPLAVTLRTDDGREVALLGAIRVDVSPDTYLRRLQDIVSFKRSAQVEAIGVFGVPPSTADLGRLTLADNEVTALRRCRAGACDLQVSAAMLATFPSAGPAEAYATAFREALVKVLDTYRAEGRTGLPTYVDDDTPVSLPEQVRALIASDQRLLPSLADWRRVLLEGSVTGPAVDASLLYWSRERLGRASVISLTHLLTGRADALAPGARVAASLQLYASHYFDASLGLTILWPAEHGTVLVYYNRSRVDTFDGLLGGMLRGVVRSRARASLRTHLSELQRRLADAK